MEAASGGPVPTPFTETRQAAIRARGRQLLAPIAVDTRMDLLHTLRPDALQLPVPSS